jgi:DivIVA domain-containing protein
MPTNDPRTAASIAAATFPTAFRGYDQAEVRRFLEQVGARVDELTAERDELAGRPGPELDEATASVLLGEEAGKILATAREGAAHVRQRAEEGAGRLVQQAQEQADRLRSEAAADAARLRAEAATDAEAEREAAREEGRQMVAEARAVRERMLADLARRRDAARLQLEQLRSSRDHILVAFDGAGAAVRQAMLAAGAAVDEAAAAVRATEAELPPEPPGLELPEPSSGPTVTGAGEPAVGSEPIVGADVAGAAEAAPEDVEHPAGELESLVEEAAPEPATEAEPPSDTAAPAETPAGPDTVAGTGGAHVEGEAQPSPEVVEPEGAGAAVEGDQEDLADGGAGPAEAANPESIAVAALASASAEELGVATPAAAAADGDAGVDALFSRLGKAAPEAVAAATRSAVQEAGAEPPPLVEGAEGEAGALDARDAALDPLGAALARHLKRALSDEQNEVLDAVRRRPVPAALHDLLGTQSAHAERYRAVAEEDLWSAASAGARSVARLDETELHGALDRTGALEAGLDDVTNQMVAPLRERLARALQQSGGDAVEAASLLRAAYREWKTQRVDELASQLVVASHGRGAFAAVPDGARIRWVLGPGGGRCSECEPGAGATVRAGQPFPIGRLHPPAHPGCRCLIVRVPG